MQPQNERVREEYKIHGKGYVDEYQIEYEWEGAWWRINCLKSPHNPWRYEPDEQVKHHLMKDDHVCVVKGEEPKTLEAAVALCFIWMEGYSHFCRYRVFPDLQRRYDIVR